MPFVNTCLLTQYNIIVFECPDINECERKDACKQDQICINIQGGYICSNKLNCEPGFRLNEETNQCDGEFKYQWLEIIWKKGEELAIS